MTLCTNQEPDSKIIQLDIKYPT